MWENTKKKRIILNIFLGLLIVAVVVVLAYFVMQIQAENRAHDEELSKIY
jgi:flagellar basal body-associated protein FliL